MKIREYNRNIEKQFPLRNWKALQTQQYSLRFIPEFLVSKIDIFFVFPKQKKAVFPDGKHFPIFSCFILHIFVLNVLHLNIV